MFEDQRTAAASRALLERAVDATRAESRAAAQRLIAIAELFVLALRDSGENADYAVDTWLAVAAQTAAALRISAAAASRLLEYALAMRERLPRVGAAFEAGDIDLRMFQAMVFRTNLITSAEALAAVDERLAVLAPRWPSMNRKKLDSAIDKVIAHHDRDAVRRAKSNGADRYVHIGESDPGIAECFARLHTTTGLALDKRLDELAATVCDADPRSKDQRRADALGCLAAGADRLVCGCGLDSCSAASMKPPNSNVLMHIVADQSTIDGTSESPGWLAGAPSLIPAVLVRELAAMATRAPIKLPIDAPPEPTYLPSRALAEFVRCRDLTCRAPGCDAPAMVCDIDHTVPHGNGGATHAFNLKCLCRLHHLVKTFLGWQDRQLPDGTVIWTMPDGQVHVTTPGSALLFPALCLPFGRPRYQVQTEGERTVNGDARMPRRRRTRRQRRTDRVAAERRSNRERRERAKAHYADRFRSWTPADDEDPPPF